MNGMLRVAVASKDDRRDLFLTTAQRLGCAPENVEKDFWLCWTLDMLYNKAGIKPRLLFKGGTSLSKAWGLIRRWDSRYILQNLPQLLEVVGVLDAEKSFA